ncbi:hypothetical protein CR513_45974, partial [Mucuna pruriens]
MEIFNLAAKLKSLKLELDEDLIDQDVAARLNELQKSSRFIFTSLAKLESALNTDTLGKIGHPVKLLGPQNDHESVMCKEIHKSICIPSQAKPSNDPIDISYEDDKINLLDNDSKAIIPLNDCLQSNSVQMMKGDIDTKDYSNKMEICTSNYKRVTPSKVSIKSNFPPTPDMQQTPAEINVQTCFTLTTLPGYVLQGQPANQLLKAYAIHWMPPFSGLKYASDSAIEVTFYLALSILYRYVGYILFCTRYTCQYDGGHWYLVVKSELYITWTVLTSGTSETKSQCHKDNEY